MAPPETPVSTKPAPPFPEGWSLVVGATSVTGAHPSDQDVAARVSRYVDEALPRIADFLGLPLGPRIRVYVAHTEDQFAELQPGSPPEWAEATAWPAQGLVFVRAPRLRSGTAEPLDKVLDHELTHVVVGQAFAPRTPPRWLQEGLAQYVAREYTPEMTRRIARGMLGNRLLTLEDLQSGFPTDPLRAQLAYAQSADFVAWIRNEFGEEALHGLVRDLARGVPMRAAVRDATGMGLEEADDAWRRRLQGSRLALAALFSEDLWWGVGALVLVVGALGVRRRNRVRRIAMEREEAFQDAMARLAAQIPTLRDQPAWDNEAGRWVHPVPPVGDPDLDAGDPAGRGSDKLVH